MKKNESILIIGLVAIVIILGIFLFSRNSKVEENNLDNNVNNVVNKEENSMSQTLSDGTKVNVSPKLKETKKIDKLEISEIQLTHKEGKTIFLAKVTNKGSEKTEKTLIDIELYDKMGNKMVTIPGVIKELEPEENIQLNTTLQIDYTNAYDLKLIKK